MTKSALLLAVSTITAVCILTGCGQSATNSSSEVSTTQLATPAPVQNNLAQPAGNIMDQPDAGVNFDQPGDRNVTVNAPFSATKIDRDTGSVHIDAPFVHIDKAGRGQKMHIDIGGDSSASNSR
jgi:hypothetical protein